MPDKAASSDHNPIYAVVLAGGSGTRLWPLSLQHIPKQFLKIGGNETLLQETVRRILPTTPPSHILTVTSSTLREKTEAQLTQLDPALSHNILFEPAPRNTLPAICWATGEILRRNPAAIVGVYPSDHQIRETNFLIDTVRKAIQAAQQGCLVTLGIPPRSPETGFGYIEAGPHLPGSEARKALRFVEKPTEERAREFLDRGNYFWNAGIFFFSLPVFLEELQRHYPRGYDTVLARSQSQSKDAEEPAREAFLKQPVESIDTGLMEKSDRVAVIPSLFSWSDLGNWSAVYDSMSRDGSNNAVDGNVVLEDTYGSLLISPKKLLAAVGLRNMVVIQTSDATLVLPKDRAQDVKGLAMKLDGATLSEDQPTAVQRPWGCYRVLEEGPCYKVKQIIVQPGQKLSLQSHTHRAEHWVVIKGTARVTYGEKVFGLCENESTFIPRGQKHRLENPGNVPLVIIEVQAGSYLGEDDIERFDDAYGRVEKQA